MLIHRNIFPYELYIQGKNYREIVNCLKVKQRRNRKPVAPPHTGDQVKPERSRPQKVPRDTIDRSEDMESESDLCKFRQEGRECRRGGVANNPVLMKSYSDQFRQEGQEGRRSGVADNPVLIKSYRGVKSKTFFNVFFFCVQCLLMRRQLIWRRCCRNYNRTLPTYMQSDFKMAQVI